MQIRLMCGTRINGEAFGESFPVSAVPQQGKYCWLLCDLSRVELTGVRSGLVKVQVETFKGQSLIVVNTEKLAFILLFRLNREIFQIIIIPFNQISSHQFANLPLLHPVRYTVAIICIVCCA